MIQPDDKKLYKRHTQQKKIESITLPRVQKNPCSEKTPKATYLLGEIFLIENRSGIKRLSHLNNFQIEFKLSLTVKW